VSTSPPDRIHQHDVRVLRNPRIVDQDVDRPELARRRLEERGHRSLVAHVALPRPRPPAVAPRVVHECGGERLRASIRDRDGGAALGKKVGDAAADAARSAGDDGDAALQPLFGERHDAELKVQS
jgi:hypothetical protein